MRTSILTLFLILSCTYCSWSQPENISEINAALEQYEILLLAHDEAKKAEVIANLQGIITDDHPVEVLIPCYTRIGETTGELKFLQKARDLVHQNPGYNNQREIALVYHMLGRSYLSAGELDVALLHQDSSSQVIINNYEVPRVDLSRNYEYMAYSTYGQGLFQKTMALTKRAIDTLETAGVTNRVDSIQVARLANNLGYLNDQFGQSSQVIPLYKKALSYDGDYVDFHTMLATEYMNRSKYNLAIKECHLGLEKLKTSPAPLVYANLNHTLLTIYGNAPSDLFSKEVKMERINYFYEEVEKSHTKYPAQLNNIYGAATGILSDIYLLAKNPEKSKYYAEKQADLFNLWDADLKKLDSGYKNVYAAAFGRLGKIAAINNNFQKATDHYMKSIHAYYPSEIAGEELEHLTTDMLSSVQNSWNGILVDNLFNLQALQLYQALETKPVGIKFLESANHKFALIDSLLVNNLNQNLFHNNRFIATSHLMGAHISYNLHKRTDNETHLNNAFERLAKIQSLLLYNHWDDSKVKNTNKKDEEVLASIKKINEEINYIETLLNKGDSIKSKIYQVQLDSLHNNFQSLVEQNGTIMTDALGLVPHHFPDALGNYRANLKDDELGIFFGSVPRTNPSIERVLLSKTDFKWYSSPSGNLDSLSKLNLEKLSNPNSKDYSSILRKLYQLLILPIEEQIKNKELVLHLDESMKLIPFEILIDSEGQYLFETNNIRYENLHLEPRAKNSSAQTKQNILAFSASPEADQYLDALYASNEKMQGIDRAELLSHLTGANEEVNFLKETLNAKVFQGTQATKSEFIKKASDAKILHLALHAIVDNDGMASKFVFSNSNATDDSYLYYHEIDDLNLEAELVTLSACNTGMGNISNGRHRTTLALAFAYAGCTNVVQTLWNVNDNSTKELMKNFYQNMEAGITKPMALNQAKKQFLETAPTQWKHPYYWAGFLYSGDNQSIQLTTKSFFSGWKFYGMLIVALGLVIYLIRLFLTK